MRFASTLAVLEHLMVCWQQASLLNRQCRQKSYHPVSFFLPTPHTWAAQGMFCLVKGNKCEAEAISRLATPR